MQLTRAEVSEPACLCAASMLISIRPSARRYLAGIEFDSGAADYFRWPRPALMALVASQSLPGRSGRADAPREQREKISCTRRDR